MKLLHYLERNVLKSEDRQDSMQIRYWNTLNVQGICETDSE